MGSPVCVPGAGILQSTISEVNKLLSTAGTITAQLPALLPPIIDTDMSDGMAGYPVPGYGGALHSFRRLVSSLWQIYQILVDRVALASFGHPYGCFRARRSLETGDNFVQFSSFYWISLNLFTIFSQRLHFYGLYWIYRIAFAFGYQKQIVKTNFPFHKCILILFMTSMPVSPGTKLASCFSNLVRGSAAGLLVWCWQGKCDIYGAQPEYQTVPSHNSV